MSAASRSQFRVSSVKCSRHASSGGIPRQQTAHLCINAALLGIARHPVLQGTPSSLNERALQEFPILREMVTPAGFELSD
jgi:hypothetical protein